MKEMTKANVAAAFAGESQAHMRYIIFANLAEREGFANIARLFRAVSYAEEKHATAHLRALGVPGLTVKNLETAIGGETFEVDEMYPAYMAVAKLQEEKQALTGMERAFAAEKIHAEIYARAKTSAEAKKDLDLGSIFICENCGWTVEAAEPPAECPICGWTKFRKF